METKNQPTMKNIVITLITLLLWAAPMQAVQNKFRFTHIQIEDGLSSNYVRAIAQDHLGFIWIGTDEGLNRYDGQEIKQFPISSGQTVTYLYHADSTLWVGTETGLHIFCPAKEHIIPFNKQTADGISISSGVTGMDNDHDGQTWISTDSQGVFCYNHRSEELRHYPIKEPKGFISNILADSENQIWAVTNQGSNPVYRLNKADGQFHPFDIKIQTDKPAFALTIFEDSGQHLWIGTWETGLLQLNRRTGETVTYMNPQEGHSGATHIHSIMEYADHTLLIGSDDGLLMLNTLTGEHQLYVEDDTNLQSLSNRFVYPLMRDHEGGIWIGTYYGGVNYLAPNAQQFEQHQHSTVKNSINGSVISNFCEAPDGTIWIASDDGGLNLMDPDNGSFTHFMPKTDGSGLSYHNVHALCMDGDDLWIGTYSGGVNVMNTKTKRFRHYASKNNDPSSLNGNSSYAIMKDSNGNIWVGTMMGINLYNREKDNFTRIKEINALMIDIDEDREGHLWFSTQGEGIFRYDPFRQEWQHYSASQGKLASDYVNCFVTDENGQRWAGTSAGLHLFDPNTNQFNQVPLDIPSQNINSIIPGNDCYWLGTGKGLVKYSSIEGVQVFMHTDGLQSDQFLPNAALMTTDGKIYLGTANGFNAFYPHEIRTNRVAPKVVLTNVEVMGKRIEVGDERLPSSITMTDELHLSHRDHAFSLHFSSLSFCTPQKNQYAYQLKGFDEEWNFVGSYSHATYTNLEPGTYTFVVRGSNNDGVWNTEGQQLRIVIHPPFYWNIYAKILYVILLVLAFVGFVHSLLKRTERRHQYAISELNRNKEQEVREAKINFFTTIAHEIRTPVSLIIGPLEKVMQNTLQLPQSVRNDLEIIDRNSQRLLFLVNQLLDFRKVEQGGMKMKFSPTTVSDVINAVCERFKPTIEHKGHRLETECSDNTFTAIIDAEAVTKVVSNLLTNANKYTRSVIKVTCSVCTENETFSISVADDGEGIAEEDRIKIFNPFFQGTGHKAGTGIGLTIVKNIVEAHHGHIRIQSESGSGSCFIVTLPIRQDMTTADEENNPNAQESQEVPNADNNGDNPTTLNGKENKVNDIPAMLIVDDNDEMLHFLSNIFADSYRILTAEDGTQALKLLKETDVELIVSDWMMPVMNGIELCKAVRNNPDTSHIPFIMLTAKTDINSKVEGMDCGADAYIEKPFSVEYLQACIQNLIALRNMLKRKFSESPSASLTELASCSTDDLFLRRMNEVIEENFSNTELSVDFLAERLCISRSGLFAKIKTLANVTPNELIQLVRLKKAATLLAENKYRINEICYMTGFNSPSYFSKCFFKQFGMKPGEYANQKGGIPMEKE